MDNDIRKKILDSMLPGNEKNTIIGSNIEQNELLNFAKGISLKALKTYASKGNNKKVFEILEGKRPYELEDIEQSVALQIIKDNYIITKEAFRVVRKQIYQYEKEEKMIFSSLNENDNDDENENNSILDSMVYLEYLNNNNDVEKTQTINIQDLNLTSRQLEILKMYAKIKSYKEVAKLLKVSKSLVSNTIHIIRKKIDYTEIKAI